LPVWPVYVYVSRRTCRELAGALVDRDCLKLEFLVDVDGLEDVVGSIEDDQRVTGDVDLHEAQVSLCARRKGVVIRLSGGLPTGHERQLGA